MTVEPAASAPRRGNSDRWQQLVDRVAVSVEKARRKGSGISTGAEAERPMSEYPNCPMSYGERRDTIARLAKARGVTVPRV
jgi:hypothetical protein